MSEPLECPACGGEAITVDWEGGNYKQACCVGCGCSGPSVQTDDEDKAIAVWNTLPRWRWRPAAEPPVVPEGEDFVWVLAAIGDGIHSGLMLTCTYGVAGWDESDVTHWMPLPKGPTQ